MGYLRKSQANESRTSPSEQKTEEEKTTMMGLFCFQRLKENARNLKLHPDDFGSVLQGIGFGPAQHLGFIGEGGTCGLLSSNSSFMTFSIQFFKVSIDQLTCT